MNSHLQRAILLVQQSRFEMAETELRQALSHEPHDAHGHALMALCLARRKQFKEATDEAQQAIHLAPDYSYAHYVFADILRDRNLHRDAITCIHEAIRLDPEDADYRALLSQLLLDNKEWARALDEAEQGLQLDPEHIACTNLRAIALVKLGRKAEAGLAIETALTKNPENSITHANQGWTLLEQGNSAKALEHFREALRLDPENEWARQGIVEALKARNFIYAVMLRYFLWMSKLSSQAQWAIIFGGFLANRFVSSISQGMPELAPWLLPLRILYVTFVVLTWTAQPLFNLLLRLNRFGRLALSREQIVASNWVGSSIAGAIGMVIAWLVTAQGGMLFGALVFGLLVIPLSTVFNCDQGWPRMTMIGYTAFMAIVGLGAVSADLTGTDDLKPVKSALQTVFFISAFLCGWIANALVMARPRR